MSFKSWHTGGREEGEWVPQNIPGGVMLIEHLLCPRPCYRSLLKFVHLACSVLWNLWESPVLLAPYYGSRKTDGPRDNVVAKRHRAGEACLITSVSPGAGRTWKAFYVHPRGQLQQSVSYSKGLQTGVPSKPVTCVFKDSMIHGKPKWETTQLSVDRWRINKCGPSIQWNIIHL